MSRKAWFSRLGAAFALGLSLSTSACAPRSKQAQPGLEELRKNASGSKIRNSWRAGS
ncbi:MAG: hypothetical protein QM756_22690 [Polyangiaceae bacterium]